jgi:hypothetical protein
MDYTLPPKHSTVRCVELGSEFQSMSWEDEKHGDATKPDA